MYPELKLKEKNEEFVTISYLSKYGKRLKDFFYYFLLTLKNYIFNYSEEWNEFVICGHNIKQICTDLLYLYQHFCSEVISYQHSFTKGITKNPLEISQDINMLQALFDHLIEGPALSSKIHQQTSFLNYGWSFLSRNGLYDMIWQIGRFSHYYQRKVDQINRNIFVSLIPNNKEVREEMKEKSEKFTDKQNQTKSTRPIDIHERQSTSTSNILPPPGLDRKENK